MQTVTLAVQTLYAELVDRCSVEAFETEFPTSGSFVRVPVKGRVYWYFQEGARDESGRQPRKYVGPDTAELRRRVENHGHAMDDYRERRHLIALLRRSGFQGPSETAGRIIQTLAESGIFRLRACLIGTSAYQLYGPLLGVRLPSATLQTGDLDIAQFTSISVAIGEDEQAPPLLETLKQADPTFRLIPSTRPNEPGVAYINAVGYRVEILTESRGPETDAPVHLPAISAYAQPMRFLDFLIYEEIPAAMLHGGGVLVNVPDPARYALHKLIVAQRRRSGTAKIDKDLLQAEALIEVLAQKRPADLREVWREAMARGPSWRRLLVLGLAMISRKVRDQALLVFGEMRSTLPDVFLRFEDYQTRYDETIDQILFEGWDGREPVLCAVTGEAMDVCFASHGFGGRKPAVFSHNRPEIESIAQTIYLRRPVTADGKILIKTSDVDEIRAAARAERPSPEPPPTWPPPPPAAPRGGVRRSRCGGIGKP